MSLQRFVILLHQVPEPFQRPTGHHRIAGQPVVSGKSHWDWMFEDGQHLLTWACETEPCLGFSAACEKLGDHRLDYLSYEGDISENRGFVQRVSCGEFQLLEFDANRLIVQLFGEWSGRLTISRVTGTRWTLQHQIK